MRYTVHGTATVSVTFEVDADSEAEAIELAENEIPGLNVYEGTSGDMVGLEHDDAHLSGEYAVTWYSAEPADS